jgi:hypothetical protein
VAAFIQFTTLKKEDTRIYLHIRKSLNEHNINEISHCPNSVWVCVDIASDKIRQFLRISVSFQVKTVVKLQLLPGHKPRWKYLYLA